MDNNEKLTRFEQALSAGRARTQTFEEICSGIGVSPRAMDRCLRDTLGVSGEIVVKCYKFDLPLLCL